MTFKAAAVQMCSGVDPRKNAETVFSEEEGCVSGDSKVVAAE